MFLRLMAFMCLLLFSEGGAATSQLIVGETLRGLVHSKYVLVVVVVRFMYLSSSEVLGVSFPRVRPVDREMVI